MRKRTWWGNIGYSVEPVYYNDEIELLNTFYDNENITFRIDELTISTPLTANINKKIKSNLILFTHLIHTHSAGRAITTHTHPHTCTAAHATTPTTINVKRLDIYSYMRAFNTNQTENLFEMGLCSGDVITLQFTFLTSKQLETC